MDEQSLLLCPACGARLLSSDDPMTLYCRDCDDLFNWLDAVSTADLNG